MSKLGDRIRSEAAISDRPGQMDRLEAIARDVEALEAQRAYEVVVDAGGEHIIRVVRPDWEYGRKNRVTGRVTPLNGPPLTEWFDEPQDTHTHVRRRVSQWEEFGEME